MVTRKQAVEFFIEQYNSDMFTKSILLSNMQAYAPGAWERVYDYCKKKKITVLDIETFVSIAKEALNPIT